METKRRPGRPRKVPRLEEVKVTPVIQEPFPESTVIREVVGEAPVVARGTTCPFLSILKGGWTDCIRQECALWGGNRCGLVALETSFVGRNPFASGKRLLYQSGQQPANAEGGVQDG